jgi:hypothetical protein
MWISPPFLPRLLLQLSTIRGNGGTKSHLLFSRWSNHSETLYWLVRLLRLPPVEKITKAISCTEFPSAYHLVSFQINLWTWPQLSLVLLGVTGKHATKKFLIYQRIHIPEWSKPSLRIRLLIDEKKTPKKGLLLRIEMMEWDPRLCVRTTAFRELLPIKSRLHQ